MAQKKKGKSKVLTDRAKGSVETAKSEVLGIGRFLRDAVSYISDGLLYVAIIGLGVLFLYGVVGIGEVVHRVLGINLMLFGGLAGFFRLFMEMSVRLALVQAARLIAGGAALCGLVYVCHGYLILAVYVLPISLLILVGGHYLYRFLTRPEVIEEPDGTRGAYR